MNGNFKTISTEDWVELECFIQENEVWDAIKQCGSRKARVLMDLISGLFKDFGRLLKKIC